MLCFHLTWSSDSSQVTWCTEWWCRLHSPRLLHIHFKRVVSYVTQSVGHMVSQVSHVREGKCRLRHPGVGHLASQVSHVRVAKGGGANISYITLRRATWPAK